MNKYQQFSKVKERKKSTFKGGRSRKMAVGCHHKKCFPTRKHAEGFVENRNKKGSTREKMKTYKCEFCGNWHLYTKKKWEA